MNSKKKFHFKEKIKEFCGETSLHGFKYVTEDGFNWIQRVLWICLVLGSLSFFFYLFLPILNKYNTTATITTYDTSNYKINNIEFPAITVCSNIRVSRRRFVQAIKNEPWKTLMERDKNKRDKILPQMITNAIKFNDDPNMINTIPGVDKAIADYGHQFSSLMAEITPSCERMFLFCKWKGQRKICQNYIKQTKTDDGYCCSFNVQELTKKLEENINTTVKTTVSRDTGDSNTDNSNTDNSNTDNSNTDNSNTDDSNTDNSNTDNSNTDDSNTDNSNTDNSNTAVSKPSASSYPEILKGYFKADFNECKGKTPKANPEPTFSRKQLKFKRSLVNDILRTSIPGKYFGFSFQLDPMVEDEYRNYAGSLEEEALTQNSYHGFQVLIHSPSEFPKITNKATSVGIGTETYIAVSAMVTESSETVQNMDPTRRKCLFPKDKEVPSMGVHLKAFDKYSKKNCLLECQANEMLKTCGCLIYYLPDINTETKNYTSCSYKQLQCLSQNQKKFNSITEQKTSNSENEIYCSCPDDCDEVIYNQEISSQKLYDHNQKLKNLMMCKPDVAPHGEKDHVYVTGPDGIDTFTKPHCNMEFINEEAWLDATFIDDTAIPSCAQKTWTKKMAQTSLVHVYFKDMGVTKLSRDELYSWGDIVAQFGGTVGLCMGFSLLSGCEIIYFAFIRAFLRK